MASLETQQLDEVIAGSRRRMLTLGGAALAGIALTSVVKAQTTTPALTDADYLNFALNLEYLEANFYTLAATGQTIDQLGIGLTGVGTQGTVTVKAGGPAACKVTFANSLVGSYATEIAQEERNHVAFLRSALGAAAVAQPAIDLVNSFNGLATLLMNGTVSLNLTGFDPFANDINFLLGSYIFEDVGVTAYTGAAPLLASAAYLDAAAGIQGVEAYHAGLVRTTIYGLDQSATTLGPAGTASIVASAISTLRATVDGTLTKTQTKTDDIGLGTQTVSLNVYNTTPAVNPLVASTLVNATTTGSINVPGGITSGSLVFARTAAQVLSIVYAGGMGKGGFFPAGLNGTVK